MRTTWWILGVSSIALLATSAVWTSGAHGSLRSSSHRDPVSAHAALRHSTPEPLAITPAPAPTVEPPSAVTPRPVTPRAARSRITPPVAILVEDESPPPSTPLSWDDLFPRSPKQSSRR